MPRIITLTSDLGEQEPFAASIKGAILSLAPDANLLDLSHQISAHDVTEAALFALGAVPHFPAGTVHLINVAPGPTPIAARINDQIVLCPDNGVLTLLEDHYSIEEARAIPISETIANRSEQTFFGREIFAPAAAALAGGTQLSDFSSETLTPRRLDWPQPDTSSPKKVDGSIMHVDRFGNLVTNLHRSLLAEKTVERIAVSSFSIFGLSERYTDAAPQHALALFGQSGYLEIAYNGDRANERLSLEPGIKISVFLS